MGFEDTADFEVLIQNNTISETAVVGFAPGLGFQLDNVSGQLLVLDNRVEFCLGPGVILEQDGGTVNALFDDNRIRENGQIEGDGMCLELLGGTLNVGITRNVFDNNDDDSELVTDGGTVGPNSCTDIPTR